MKSLIVVVSLLLCSATYAQEKKQDTKKETETKTVKVKTDKGTTEQKLKVTTTETEDVKLKENPDHSENMTRVKSDSKVTQTVEFENDFDPFYQSDVSSKSFMNDESTYMFEPNDSGFKMSMNENSAMSEVGSARLTSVKRLYLIEMDGKNGVGYFNKDGNFVVEMYDKDTAKMMIREFKGMNQ